MDRRYYLLLKWGTLKGWNLPPNSPAKEQLKIVIQNFNAGCMQDDLTNDLKKSICDLIDLFEGGIISNDFTGEVYTKEQAKKYIMEY